MQEASNPVSDPNEVVVGELLRADRKPAKVIGSHFGIDKIRLAVRIVMDAAVSMRASSRVCEVLADIAGQPAFEQPCHTTIQNFILRIGLYLIEHRDQQRPDRVWIIDHTIAAGTTKCLVVLSIELSKYQQLDRAIELRDVEVLSLLPVERSTGAIVHRQLTELSTRFGVPAAILSDRGSDLKKGIELLQNDYPSVQDFYDIVHLVSRLIEKALTANEQWSQFRKACCQCANLVRQSSLSHLKPPRPKTKARYMNIDREVRWAHRALAVLDRVRSGNLTARQHERLPLELVEEKFGWLDEYRASINDWKELSLIGQKANKVIRRHGYSTETVEFLRNELDPTGLASSGSQQLATQIIERVEPMCQAVGSEVKYPGSSEIIESLIGKGKRLLGQTNNNSLTRQLLAMATATAQITPELIRVALSTCRIKHLQRWCSDQLPRGIHSKRREDLSSTPEEQKLRKANPTPTPIF